MFLFFVNDTATTQIYTGWVVGSVRGVEGTGMEERLSGLGIDIALLPINGRAPERRVAGNLFGEEAARLAQAIGARVVIPCHYEMFEFNTASPEEFSRECERLGQGSRVLNCGERWSSDGLGGA